MKEHNEWKQKNIPVKYDEDVDNFIVFNFLLLFI